MRGASFIGHKRLLLWINALCETELTRVEQLCSGAIACQVLDVMYPNRVPMTKVDWTATQPYEFMWNYKVLQKVLTALKVGKEVPVDRLIRGKYQDNLEFLQWLKSFYDRQSTRSGAYDALAQRAKGKGGSRYKYNADRSDRLLSSTPLRKKRARLGLDSVSYDEEQGIASEFKAVVETMQQLTITSKGLMEEKEALVAQIRELREAIKRMKNERDFYAKKLEAIGELVHAVELSKTSSAQTNLLGLSILDVVHATEEDEHDEELPF
uniref:Calponin-homology (CH) domain-containing protein n=1 Tax=Hyaloperonospora arabidopsidis (strain Emoy2) TaxID=559515 RepID=M4C695_HYAAE